MSVSQAVGKTVKSPLGIDADPGVCFVDVLGLLTFAGTYTAGAGGDGPISWAGIPGLENLTPSYVWIAGTTGYTFCYVPSTGKVKIYTAGNTELTTQTYAAAGISADTIIFQAYFPKV